MKNLQKEEKLIKFLEGFHKRQLKKKNKQKRILEEEKTTYKDL